MVLDVSLALDTESERLVQQAPDNMAHRTSLITTDFQPSKSDW